MQSYSLAVDLASSIAAIDIFSPLYVTSCVSVNPRVLVEFVYCGCANTLHKTKTFKDKVRQRVRYP